MDIPIIDNVIGEAEDLVTDAVGGAAESAADAAINAMILYTFDAVTGAIETLTGALIDAMQTTSTLDLNSPQFAGLDSIRNTVLTLSLFLVLGFFLINVLSALTRGEPGPIIRAAAVDLPAAILLTTLYTSFTWALIQIVDATSNQILGDMPTAIGNIAGTITVAASTTTEPADTAGTLLTLLFGFLWIAAALLVWAQLLIRSALILIVIVMAPLGYASRASAGSRQLARRTTEVLVALIASKLGIALAFGIGSTLINNSVTVDDTVAVQLGPMFTGCIVLLLAAFMPWMLLKAIPIMETASLQGGSERSPLKAASVGAGVALTAMNLGRMSGRVGGEAMRAGSGTARPGAGIAGPRLGDRR
jgi:hypothetical protein